MRRPIWWRPDELGPIFCDLGAVHMQVGKSYPYLLGRQEQATRILKDVKKSLDPDNRMNPGALGL